MKLPGKIGKTGWNINGNFINYGDDGYKIIRGWLYGGGSGSGRRVMVVTVMVIVAAASVG